MGALSLIEAPSPVIELAEAKAFLRVTDDDSSVINDDPLITALVATATAHLDGETGLLARALGRQRWRLSLDGFPVDGVEVPLPPLQTVDLIRYRLPDGTTADLAPSAYRVAIPGAASGIVRPVGLWPATAPGEATVEVQFTAGYDRIPAPILTAILQHVALLYENREAAAYGTASFQTVPFAGWALVEPFQRPFFG